MDIGSYSITHTPAINSWDAFYDALCSRFYPPGYHQILIARWLKLRQLLGRSVKTYIDIFYKLWVQLHVQEIKEVLVVKFNYGFLSFLRREVELFDITSLDKAFL